MTWAEFQLRLIAFNRAEKREEHKMRRMAWISYIAPHQDPKKLRGMTERKFWNIEGEKRPRVSEEARQRFLEEYKKYLDKTKHGRT